MKNMTVALPEEVWEKIRKHEEINWSGLIRKLLNEWIDEYERLKDLREADKLARDLNIPKSRIKKIMSKI